MIGVQTTGGDTYSPTDVFHVHTGYSTTAVQRPAGGWWCAAANKTQPLSGITEGGCVPAGTQWGYAIRGPVYAGIGPAVDLAVGSAKEPGVGLSVAMSGTVTVKGLVPGGQYALHQVATLAAVPASSTAVLAGTPLTTFVAAASTYTLSVTFPSGTPAYFICVVA